LLRQLKNTSGNNSFDPLKSVRRTQNAKANSQQWSIKVPGKIFFWSSKMDRILIIRNGLPYESTEIISPKANFPIKKFYNY
jgi:hypothetical protein